MYRDRKIFCDQFIIPGFSETQIAIKDLAPIRGFAL